MIPHLACFIRSPPCAWNHQIQWINNLYALTYQIKSSSTWTHVDIPNHKRNTKHRILSTSPHATPSPNTHKRNPWELTGQHPELITQSTHHEPCTGKLPQCSESQFSGFTMPMMITQSTLQVGTWAVTLTLKLPPIWILYFGSSAELFFKILSWPLWWLWLWAQITACAPDLYSL